jgi:hypothetical protein
MTIYEYRTSMTVAAASFSSVTHNVRGGILNQVYIVASTATTVFKANLQDKNGFTRKNWDFVEGELNDDKLYVPITGEWTVNITNVSPNDTFNLVLAVQE